MQGLGFRGSMVQGGGFGVRAFGLRRWMLSAAWRVWGEGVRGAASNKNTGHQLKNKGTHRRENNNGLQAKNV